MSQNDLPRRVGASAPREPAGHDVEDGREDQAEDGDADHAEEHGGAQSLTHLGGGAGRDREG